MVFFWWIDFKIPLVSHGLLLLFISFRLSLLIDTCLLSISVILLEKIEKIYLHCPQKHLEYYPSLLSLNL